MEKIRFKEKAFEYSLIGYIILLLCWNFYRLTTGNIKALLPIPIQGILIYVCNAKYVGVSKE
ncbi:hypothetical protein [Flavivirga jejuensis]|uniref:Uncharacterized protein n=1 Tax=Flavivirga jejuensis TaxID=870487 RepID=A0ABT8WUC9_9FLAO|nr:hypothetical protein [Flavivirga jejuensis]MDO5976790.1 hypothetical protein [Flavivirga jejuensis]